MNKRNKTLWILGLMAFLANGDNYATISLLGDIAVDLGINISSAGLSVTAYMMAYGIFTLLFGPLSDRFGKANVINVAAMGTALFSMICALAFNLSSLVFLRAMNGLFGAGILPVTIALTGELYPKEERQKALGTIMGMAFLGAATASAFGGALAFFGSWRFVYFIYGAGEMVLALLMLKVLTRDKAVTDKIDFFTSYKSALANHRFMRLVSLLFLVGFSILGSFTYGGVLITSTADLNIMQVGLILSLFGAGTVIGGRTAPRIRIKLKNGFLIMAGLLGALSLASLATFDSLIIRSFAFLGFGMAFMFLQSTLITTAQEKMPAMKGTAMSLASFFMFLGGALGTFVNGSLIASVGIEQIYYNSAILLPLIAFVAAYFIAGFEKRKKQALETETKAAV
ncbi:MAG: MFS transporter [Spirochaetales bacterium]|nr:MFS transporter [Spirochaetales bacterium]